MKRFACCVEYNGKEYQGWQCQNGMKTVQAEIEEALSRVASHKTTVHCAGRTDSGVHSLGQVIHFDSKADRKNYEWVGGVNSFLPKDIRMRWCQETKIHFHARYSALTRRYSYYIHNNRIRTAIFDGRLAWVPFSLDHTLMQRASQFWLGEKDFAAFRAKGCQAKTSKRNIFEIRIARKSDIIVISIEANSFLQKMVRNLVGTLIEIGAKRKKVEWAKFVLNSRDRNFAGATAPPEGLYLTQVKYPVEFMMPNEDDCFTKYFL